MNLVASHLSTPFILYLFQNITLTRNHESPDVENAFICLVLSTYVIYFRF